MIKKNVTIYKNWMKIYHDMEKLFESWKRRKLTVFGKSCIIKTLATSKLVYIASILCIPDKEYICKVQRLLFNFIWDKSERIKRNTLIGDIIDGGLSIIDIESKFKALKAAWIPRLLSSKGTLFEILESFMEKANLNLHYVLQFSETNLNALDRIGKLPLFYKQILSSFNECKQRCNFDNISPNDILKQPIWNNSNIKIKGEKLFFKNWVNSNILYLKDLIYDNGNIKTLQVLSTIMKRKSNWLCEYKTLLSVIKPLCKKYNFTNVKYLNIKNEMKFHFATGVSCLNKNLIHKIFVKPCYQTKLSQEFAIPVKDSNLWKNMYTRKVKDIIDNKIAEFNYKMLHNIFCNNAYLSKWLRDKGDNCNICKTIENTKHLLFECKNVEHIWRTLGSFL